MSELVLGILILVVCGILGGYTIGRIDERIKHRKNNEGKQ
tara:strand:- start:740 stop:859 length:120 start_codon:yes stop_codon:yes gene_type:complete